MQTNDFVTINGLRWDRENLSIDGKEHFNHEEALAAAESLGKRLPTQDEWQALIDSGSTWDDEKQGRWFGSDHELKNDSKESIFLPAAGYRYDSYGTLNSRGFNGYYWSTRRFSNASNAYYLGFYSGYASANYANLRIYGFSVRFIHPGTASKKPFFPLLNRLSFVAFSAIATIATCESLFNRSGEHLFYIPICLGMIGINAYLYLKNEDFTDYSKRNYGALPGVYAWRCHHPGFAGGIHSR